MDQILKSIPHKSYNKFGIVALTVFTIIGGFLIGLAKDLEFKATLQSHPDNTLASDKSTGLIESCSRKYTQEFYPSWTFHYLVILYIVTVLVTNTIYAYSVNHRVEIFVENQARSGISQAAYDPMSHRKSARSYIVFTSYVIHLIVCRIAPSIVFALVFLSSSNFPVQYQCDLSRTSNSIANLAKRQSTNVIVNCYNPMGKKNEKFVQGVLMFDFIFGTLASIELVYLLWLAWKDCNLFTDREFCGVYLLRKGRQTKNLIEMIRESLSADIFDLYDDFGDTDSSSRKLEDMYINVIIQEGREITYNSGKRFGDRHETYMTHLRLANNVTILKEPLDLFKPKSEHDSIPKSVLVIGRPGIGKTFLTKKILYQWRQKLFEFWHDKIVILIRFRIFNKAEGKTSLREAIRYGDGLNIPLVDFNILYEFICLMPSRLVLIFDGLDELKVNEQYLTEQNNVPSYNEKTHIFLIFKQLLRGKLLPGVTLLTTSRPTAEHIYDDKSLPWKRKAEILGFHKGQIHDYVKKFCKNNEKSSEIWNLIEPLPELLSLCYIPVNSYIVCLTLKKSIDMNLGEEAKDRKDVPRTMTELYNRAVKILLFKHHVEYKDKKPPKGYSIKKLPEGLQNDLDKHKEIAFEGMVGNQLIFEFPNDDEFVTTELSNCGLLNKLEDEDQHTFCFLHLTIQEFLAAQHVVDDIENVEKFLSDRIGDPRWHLVILFVAGLVGDKIKQLQAERTTAESLNSERTRNNERCKRVMEWFQDRFKDCKLGKRLTKVNQDILFLIRCVNEMQEINVMESIASMVCWGDEEHKEFLVKNIDIAPVESPALVEFVSHIKNLNKLSINSCSIEHSVVRGLANKLLIKTNSISELDVSDNELKQKGAKDSRDSLKNVNCKFIKLRISGSELTADSAKCLSEALKGENCKFTELDVRFNKLTDDGAKYLSEALKSQSCKLTKLDVAGNKLTNDGAKYLSEALQNENCKLTELDVGFNKLTNDGAGYLSEALKSKSCKLTKLGVGFNELTARGAWYLSDALKSKNCKLTKLDVADNKLTDYGARYLSDAFKSENCKLTELNVAFNKLTADGARYFSDALKSENCKLTELNVAKNKLTGDGARYLSDALKSKNCKLTELNVARNELTVDSARYLSDALKSKNCKLMELNVARNELTVDGAGYLSDALKSKNCKLTKLYVAKNKLTADGARYLSDALKSKNCKLTKLDVARNELTADGAGYLSDALKSENCKLTELNVTFNKLIADGAKYLSDALKSQSCKLTILVMIEKGLTDDGIRYLSDALKNENCKLTKLWVVAGDKITADGARYLSDALKNENCKLTEIHVTYNTLTADGAEHLSEGLKSQSRKHTKLNVAGNKLTDDGALYLSDALKSENCKLTELRVVFNELTDEGNKYLSEGVKSQSCKLVRTELVVAANKLTDYDARYLQLT